MNKCKHHYFYAYESVVDEDDVKGLKSGWADTTAPCIFVGMKMSFYVCGKCSNMLIAERLKK